MSNIDNAAVRAHVAGNVGGVIVAAGSDTTHASANTENLIAHGAVDKDGNAFPASKLLLLALPTSSAGALYQGTAISATQFDVRSSGTAVPFNWFVILKN